MQKKPLKINKPGIVAMMLERLLGLWQARQIRIAFEQRLAATKSLLEIYSTWRATAARNDLQNHVCILNIMQFAVLIYRDLSTITHEILQPRHWQVHHVHMRLWALVIYECFYDFHYLLGKDFRTAAQALELDSVAHTVGKLNRSLNLIKDKHNGTVHEIRNTVIAHRELDANRQLQVSDSISLVEVSSLSRELEKWLDALQEAFGPALDKVGRDLACSSPHKVNSPSGNPP